MSKNSRWRCSCFSRVYRSCALLLLLPVPVAAAVEGGSACVGWFGREGDGGWIDGCVSVCVWFDLCVRGGGSKAHAAQRSRLGLNAPADRIEFDRARPANVIEAWTHAYMGSIRPQRTAQSNGMHSRG